MNQIKLISIIFLCFSLPILTQTFTIGAGTGLNFIQGNNYYTDDFGRIGLYENINGTNTNLIGMKLNTEWQFQVLGKYFFENSLFSLTAGFVYLPMRGYEPIYIYDFMLDQEIKYDGTTKMDIWCFQIETNYSFDLQPVKPFINFSLSANYFDDVWIEYAQADYLIEFRSYKNGMRYGYSAGIGMEYYVISNLMLELSSNYNSFNPVNKREGEELLNTINVLFNINYTIN